MIELSGVASPILSRPYQELSNGMLGFNQCLKIADIPFPFPFAQLTAFLIRTFTLIFPFYLARFTQGVVVTPILAFGITLAMWSLSEISCELENPFLDGSQQIPIIDMHERFVESLRMVYLMPRRRRRRALRKTAAPEEVVLREELEEAPGDGAAEEKEEKEKEEKVVREGKEFLQARAELRQMSIVSEEIAKKDQEPIDARHELEDRSTWCNCACTN
eukprot:TRINITY_DN29100_c0_g1_i1.p1 TRINITY_DN29100_c0_g1~~TRINITY_DN29100_c0_g1_i1.p1  ORF type:complete len:218 (-),score=46.25 TRINITY_DN29100_c0_g1_i1:91-744(-)